MGYRTSIQGPPPYVKSPSFQLTDVASLKWKGQILLLRPSTVTFHLKMHRVAILVLAALAAQTATGFILPAPQRHYSSSFQLGAVLSSQTAARDLGVKIFDDENNIRTAYDEWRVEFGKGAFNDQRFQNFKQNFKTLTVANFEAEYKAFKEGTNPPGWMYLNEFGDFSQGEYDALTAESDIDTYKIYEDWCNEFGVKADANRYGIFLANYKSMKSYAKQTGKNLKLNKFADWTKAEAENGKKAEPKPAAQPQSAEPTKTPAATPIANNKEMKEFIQQRGTRILQYANGVSSVEQTTAAPRSTLAIGSVEPVQGRRRVQSAGGSQQYSNTQTSPSDANQSFQGTRQIAAVSGTGRGTRVVQAIASAAKQAFQGTRAIQPGSTNQSFQGTRQIPPANGMAQGTRAIQPGNGQLPSSGTRAIQPVAPNDANQQFQGTRAIQPTNPAGGNQGTRQISSVTGDSAPTGGEPFQGTRRISDIPEQRPFRGTIAINQPPKDT
ncbi:unnamed protein product [Cylindrotheca closterium]|uniref:Cathepsin propeptide inhibitor domain-containing protein n=1 Tax=Cylindrotheca closterium TaxID=2856 RepID=A0AAD2CQI6_9STRA|nr:unnamed protein product [Cylindrotheca closterium]